MKSKKPLKTQSRKAEIPSVPGQWLYMNEKEVGVSELFAAVEEDFAETEVWKEAGVLEIPLGDKSSMDLERTECIMDDDFSNQFLQEQKAKVLYLVTFPPDDYAAAEKAMKRILAVCGGFFCGDTEDFTPQVR